MSFSVTVRTAVAQVQGCFQCLLSKVLCAPHVQWFLSGLHVKKSSVDPRRRGLSCCLEVYILTHAINWWVFLFFFARLK